MSTLEHLNAVNDIPVHAIESEEFALYGNIIKGYDFSELINYMEEKTHIPETGNVYVASVEEMEKFAVKNTLQAAFYGGLPIQIGYCNGRNSTFNGFEYHKGSEINVAVTDCMLALGHTWEIRNNHYDNRDAKVFFVPKGTAFEMFQTTLHLSPLKTSDEGFKAVVVLPKGTNTPLSDEEKSLRTGNYPEEQLLLQRNKWVIAHPEREPLIKQGAFPGIIGENTEMKY